MWFSIYNSDSHRKDNKSTLQKEKIEALTKAYVEGMVDIISSYNATSLIW